MNNSTSAADSRNPSPLQPQGTPQPAPAAAQAPDPAHRPSPIDTSEQSIAGEEDPGAGSDSEPD